METLGKTLTIGWDSRWIFKPVVSLFAFSGSLGRFASMLDELAAVIIGIIVIYLVIKGLIYQYRFITIPEIKNFGIK